MSSPSFSELLHEELNRTIPHSGGVRCKSCVWFSQLDSVAQQAFDECVRAAPQGYVAALFRAAKQVGLTAGKSAFGAHLRRHHLRDDHGLS